MTKIGRISLDTSKRVCVTNVFQDVICSACNKCNAMCFFSSKVTSIHSIHKITKIRNSETLKKMEGDTEDSPVQDSKDKEIQLISRKVSRKGKDIQKKKLRDTQFESNINTVAEELASSESIASKLS